VFLNHLCSRAYGESTNRYEMRVVVEMRAFLAAEFPKAVP